MLFYPGFNYYKYGFRQTPEIIVSMFYNSGFGLEPTGYHFWGITPFSREIGGISPGGPCYLTQYDYQFVKPGYLTYSGHFTLTERDCTVLISPYIITGSLTPDSSLMMMDRIGIYKDGNLVS